MTAQPGPPQPPGQTDARPILSGLREPDGGRIDPGAGGGQIDAAIAFWLEPGHSFVGEPVTIHWSVTDRRSGIAWSGPVSLRTLSSRIQGLPDQAPPAGSFTFNAPELRRPVNFVLTVGGPLKHESRTIRFLPLQVPVITSLTAETTIGGFHERIEARPLDRIGVLGRGFGEKFPNDRVVLTVGSRNLDLEITEWTDTRIGARMPNEVPVVGWTIFGRGGITVAKEPPGRDKIYSNTNPVEVVRRNREPLPHIEYGAPYLPRPQTSEAQPRDPSDHFPLATDIVFRPIPRIQTSGGAPVLHQPDPVTIKLLTYNIAQIPTAHLPDWGYEGDRDALKNLDDIARHLNETDYGVVVLQEAFDPVARGRLIEATRPHYPHHAVGSAGASNPVGQRFRGLLILSKFEMVRENRMRFPRGSFDVLDGQFDHIAGKGVLHVRLRIGETTERGDILDVFTTHTDGYSREIRVEQFGLIRDFIQEKSQGRDWVLAGDLNVNGNRQSVSGGSDDEYSRMMLLLGNPIDLWTRSYSLAANPGYTWNKEANTFRRDGEKSRKRYDYILVSRPQTPSTPPPARSAELE